MARERDPGTSRGGVILPGQRKAQDPNRGRGHETESGVWVPEDAPDDLTGLPMKLVQAMLKNVIARNEDDVARERRGRARKARRRQARLRRGPKHQRRSSKPARQARARAEKSKA